MENEILVSIRTDADIVDARHKGRELATKVGFAGSDLVVIATAISELARNIISYAGGNGEIRLGPIRQRNQRGILVVAHDQGSGIADIELAMQDGYSTGRSLGLGLPGTRRLMDEFDIISEVGKGTTITLKKWVR